MSDKRARTLEVKRYVRNWLKSRGVPYKKLYVSQELIGHFRVEIIADLDPANAFRLERELKKHLIQRFKDYLSVSYELVGDGKGGYTYAEFYGLIVKVYCGGGL